LVISLKKYLDMDAEPPKETGPDPSELYPSVLTAYRAALLDMGKSSVRACATTGDELQQALVGLETILAGKLNPALVDEVQSNVEKELAKWGDRTSDYFKAKANEVRELLIVLAKTAESVGERDQRYTKRFTELTSQLRTIANLEDLGQVRNSLVQRATELKGYVDQMAQESKNSVALLQAEVSTYETKLKAVEELALRDQLTGLANRRNVEERLEWRIAHQQLFCLIILDLNRFKEVNDTYGHLAGDSLLKQFAGELRGCFRSTDLVGRWSGDEFVLVLDCDLAAAKAQLERMEKWVFGEYPIATDAGKAETKIHVDAAAGVAQWRAGETLQQLVERADSAMYSEKKLTKKAKA
jgi:diguanylate cyclase (GGDEF)-like protein